MPLFTLFGDDALSYRLANSGAKALITDCAGAAKLPGLRPSLQDLEIVAVVDGRCPSCIDFIVLARNVKPCESLKKDIQEQVRTRLAAHEYPLEIAFVDNLPMTSTGKIIRRALRDRG